MAEATVFTATQFPVPVEKIKKEKVTPPSSPKPELENIIATLFNPENTRPADDVAQEDKKDVAPAKTSDEILRELFQVLNTAPPGISKKSHKKHKKHKKKSKKRKRESKGGLSDVSGSESGMEDSGSGDKQAKKLKKDKNAAAPPRNIKKDDPEGHSASRKVKVKRERRSKSRERNRPDAERNKSEKAVDVNNSDKKVHFRIVPYPYMYINGSTNDPISCRQIKLLYRT